MASTGDDKVDPRFTDDKYKFIGTHGSRKVRKDGRYHKCGWPGCYCADIDLYRVTMRSHFTGYHDYPVGQTPKREDITRRIILIGEAQYKAERRQWLDQKNEKDRQRQQAGNLQPAAALQNSPAPNQQPTPLPQIPPPSPNSALPMPAGQRRETVQRFRCYICCLTFSSKQYTETHMRTKHEAQLILRRFQPDRMVKVQCYKDPHAVIRLLPSVTTQTPTLMGMSIEIRELILEHLLTVPTSFTHEPQSIDPGHFKALTSNKAIRKEALDLFSRFNFLVRVNVSSYYLASLRQFDANLSSCLPVINPKLAQSIGAPALTVDIFLGKVDTSGSGHSQARRSHMPTSQIFDLVYTERGFIDFLGTIQLSHGFVDDIRVSFAACATAELHKNTKKTVELYFGLLRGVQRVTYVDDGNIVKTHMTARDEHTLEDHKTIRHWRELVTLLGHQLDRSWTGLAKMTAHWLAEYTSLLGWTARTWQPITMRQPELPEHDGRRLVQSKYELSEKYAVLQLELAIEIFSNALNTLDVQSDELRQKRLNLTEVYERRFKPFVLEFPGIPDELRARIHSAKGYYHESVALWLLFRARETRQVPRYPMYGVGHDRGYDVFYLAEDTPRLEDLYTRVRADYLPAEVTGRNAPQQAAGTPPNVDATHTSDQLERESVMTDVDADLALELADTEMTGASDDQEFEVRTPTRPVFRPEHWVPPPTRVMLTSYDPYGDFSDEPRQWQGRAQAFRSDVPVDPNDLLTSYPGSTMVYHAKKAQTQLGHAINLYTTALHDTETATKREDQLLYMFEEFGHRFNETRDQLPPVEVIRYGNGGGTGQSVFGGTWIGDSETYSWTEGTRSTDRFGVVQTADVQIWGIMGALKERPKGWEEEGLEIEEWAEKALDRLGE